MPLEVRGERGDVARRRHDVVLDIVRYRLDGGARPDAAQVIEPAQRRPRRRAGTPTKIASASPRVASSHASSTKGRSRQNWDTTLPPCARSFSARRAPPRGTQGWPSGKPAKTGLISSKAAAHAATSSTRARDVRPVVARDDQRGRGAGVAQGPQPLHRRVLHAARRHVRHRVEARLLEHGAGRLDGGEVLVLGVDEVHEDRARGARSRFCQFRVACCLPWAYFDGGGAAELPEALTGRRERSYGTYRNERCSAAHEGHGWHCCSVLEMSSCTWSSNWSIYRVALVSYSCGFLLCLNAASVLQSSRSCVTRPVSGLAPSRRQQNVSLSVLPPCVT